jgi:hypothetical protein
MGGALNIYAGDPKTNPTKVRVLKTALAGSFLVVNVCGLEFKGAASMAPSGFNSFSKDVPAKAFFFAQTKVCVL